MVRSTDHSSSGNMLYNQAVNLLANSLSHSSGHSNDITDEQVSRLNLMQEIQELETKIEEVSQLLCKTSLEYMVRFQLKDDLEYYHGLIENKRHQLGA